MKFAHFCTFSFFEENQGFCRHPFWNEQLFIYRRQSRYFLYRSTNKVLKDFGFRTLVTDRFFFLRERFACRPSIK